jgi:hypothetical protein
MARAHRAARTVASLRQGASASSYRHQRDRIALRGIACHPAQPAAAHKAVLRAGSHHRSATLGDGWRPSARLGGQFVPGGRARGGSCGQRRQSPRPATGKGGRALEDGPGGSARSRPGLGCRAGRRRCGGRSGSAWPADGKRSRGSGGNLDYPSDLAMPGPSPRPCRAPHARHAAPMRAPGMPCGVNTARTEHGERMMVASRPSAERHRT